MRKSPGLSTTLLYSPGKATPTISIYLNHHIPDDIDLEWVRTDLGKSFYASDINSYLTTRNNESTRLASGIKSLLSGLAPMVLARAKDWLRLDILRVLEKPQVRALHFEMFNDGCIKVLLSNTWFAFIYYNYNKQLKIRCI